MKRTNTVITWVALLLSTILGAIFLAILYTSLTEYPNDDHSASETSTSTIPEDSWEQGDMTYESTPTTSTSSTPFPTPSTTTQGTPARRVSDNYIDLARPSTSLLDDAGLMPGTHILVIKEKVGNRVISDSCTVAFSLPTRQGDHMAVTAGHCGKPGNEVYSVPTTDYFDSAYKLGEIVYTSSPGDYEGAGDWAVVELEENAHHPENSAQIPLRVDLSDRVEGDRLCKDGSRTGYGCGRKGEDDVVVNLGGFDGEGFSGDGDRVTGILDQVFLCSLPGDSGSPIYDKDGIVGILSSSSATNEEVENGACSNSSTSKSYYSPSSDVIEQIEREVPHLGISIN